MVVVAQGGGALGYYRDTPVSTKSQRRGVPDLEARSRFKRKTLRD